ncbi:MAG: dTDP-4-dehydrorhamnose reductase [Planctomycetes bacterium GWF2_50_10]|nr:MAG: dTDP-4-dehydrorhamnose reductase [Planctomycetes bacterium GWF2_50_10]
MIAMTKNMEVAILGGKGMLGSDIGRALSAISVPYRILDLPEFDIANTVRLAPIIKNAAAVINCAAYTDVEKAQAQPDLAMEVNGHAVGRLAQLCKDSGIWLLHFGTDFVFDGTLDRPYTESNVPNPLSVYGQSKLLGEELLAQVGIEHSVIRIEWTYGQSGNNFVKKIIAACQSKNEIKVVDDQIGSPTATAEIAAMVADMLDTKPQGLYLYASSGYASRWETAQFIAQKLRLGAKILPCSSSEFKTAVQRPLNSRFDCSKIRSILKTEIKTWQQSLTNYLEQTQ